MKEPKTLQDAIKFFSDPDNCLGYMVARRWPDGVVCPNCGSRDLRFISTRRMWECKSNHARKQFTVKVGTVMEDSAIALDKWLIAMWLVANCKNGISSYELARTIGVTQKSAWFMLHRIRLAMQDDKNGDLSGIIEVDETYVGGKVRNMHKSRKLAMIKVRNSTPDWKATANSRYYGKTAVFGLLDRENRKVRASVVPNVKRETLQNEIFANVQHGSIIHSDEAVAYQTLKDKYVHEVVNHLEGYVRGKVHTNGIENFWSLLKRGLNGTYVCVEPFHLFRYVDEQVFRYNNRKDMSDFDRFSVLSANVANKRLDYAELTGKTGTTPF